MGQQISLLIISPLFVEITLHGYNELCAYFVVSGISLNPLDNEGECFSSLQQQNVDIVAGLLIWYYCRHENEF